MNNLLVWLTIWILWAQIFSHLDKVGKNYNEDETIGIYLLRNSWLLCKTVTKLGVTIWASFHWVTK